MKTHTVAIDTSGPCPQKAGEQKEKVENKMTDSSDSEFPPQVSRRGAPSQIHSFCIWFYTGGFNTPFINIK